MELPVLSFGWVVFTVVFVCAFGAAAFLVLQEIRASRERDILFKQAAARDSDVSPPTKEIEEYERKRHELFLQLLEREQVTDADEDLGEGQRPCNSWLRQLLEPEDRKALKLLLLRRALANAPRWIYLSGESNAKYRLYRHGLLTETAWMAFQAAQEELNRELHYIKLEADCIESDWGDRVLRDAIMLHRLAEAQKERARQQETEQKRQEKERERHARDKERQQEEKDFKDIQREKKAEKLREQLIREEQQQKVNHRKNSR